MRIKSHKITIIVNNEEYTTHFIFLAELGKMLKRKAVSLRKMEELGILPKSNFRMPDSKLANGKTRKGYRIYSLLLANELVKIFDGIKQGIKINNDQRTLLIKAFNTEISMIKNSK